MSLPNPAGIVDKLRRLQRQIRDAIVASRQSPLLSGVHHATSSDTIYELDVLVEPIIERFCQEWSQEMPMLVIAEGLEPEGGRIFPAGAREADVRIRVILDPIDGTRGLMYDKRSAWSLAGVAPNKGDATRLSDIQVAVMTELPTSKMAWGDVLWATAGNGAEGVREDVAPSQPPREPVALTLSPSRSDNIDHGFAMISNFFPGTKVLASELMEQITRALLPPADLHQGIVFDDQYISTSGQFYELIVGHDRFNADLRSLFYLAQRRPIGMCVHPYDACTMLIATEAGAILTDGLGNPLDAPLDVTSNLSWAGYANTALRTKIEPVIRAFLEKAGLGSA